MKTEKIAESTWDLKTLLRDKFKDGSSLHGEEFLIDEDEDSEILLTFTKDSDIPAKNIQQLLYFKGFTTYIQTDEDGRLRLQYLKD